MTARCTMQADNIVPARLGSIWVQTVDNTARPYNIGILPFGGKAIVNTNQPDHVYLSMYADGGDVYYQFTNATSATLDPAATNAAGVALTATTMSASGAMCGIIPNGSTLDVRIERSKDTWLVLYSTTGPLLRVFASSQAEG